VVKTWIAFRRLPQWCGIILALGVTAPAQPPTNSTLPKVRLQYAEPWPFDSACPGFLKTSMDRARHEEEIAEVARKLSEFQSVWDKNGVRYVEAALQEVGLPYQDRDVQATLTVCPVPSMSQPLLINVRPFLSSTNTPMPSWWFEFTVFHEMMHTYVKPVMTTSVLLKKYANEPRPVRVHLHTAALERAVLGRLNEPEKLKTLSEFYQTKAPPPYKRAWEIVNQESGEAFLRELKVIGAKAAAVSSDSKEP
jgi:hypothetical protein